MQHPCFRVRVSLIALLLPLLLAACGATDAAETERQQRSHFDGVGDAEYDDPRIPTPPLPDRKAAAARGSLTCEFNQECQSSVVMISAVVKKGIERCTGFLIAPDQVMTNDHCLSHSTAVKEFGGQCDGLVYVHVASAGNGTQAQSISCGKILLQSRQRGLGSKDFAVIQLKTPVTDRRPMKLSKRGFRDGEEATIFRVQMSNNPTSGMFEGVQVRTTCQASYKTVVYPGVQNSNSPLMTFGDCPIQKGNSGSPAFNADGEVGAVIQGFLNLQEGAKVRDQVEATMLDPTFGEVGLGTQVACIAELNRSAACTAVIPIEGRYPKDFVAALGELSVANLPALNSNERWKQLRGPTSEERIFIRTPSCVVPAASGSSFETAVVMFKRGLNHRLQAEWRSLLRPGDKNVTFTSGSSPRADQVDFVNPEFGTLTIPACTRLTHR